MEKITYKLTVLSSLIASPRANAAWYRELGEFSEEDVKQENWQNKNQLKVIYPFYQYGEYRKYAPDSANYYLPGSSVKGMLRRGEGNRNKELMADDVEIPNDKIVLRNLYKAQYLYQEDRSLAAIKPFFENVGVEMVQAGTQLWGDIYGISQASICSLFSAANVAAKAKLANMLEYLLNHTKEGRSEELVHQFQEIIDAMRPLQRNDNIFLLGGYKGLLHSLAYQSTKSAVFLDTETKMPHGLVKIELV